MSLITQLICVQCGKEYAEDSALTCSACGPDEGILDVQFDLDAAAKTLTRANLAQRSLSLWRYHELLPLANSSSDPSQFILQVGTDQSRARKETARFDPQINARCISDTHVGWTPLIEAPRLAKALGVKRILLKDDGRSPSGSFKDRASSIGVARAIQEGAKAVACASTGNAASSLACWAAVAELPCYIFVSRIVPGGKLAQLLAYGACVFKVQGTYAQAYNLCTKACERFGWYNRNAAINPYLVEGKKTGGLEVAEQCDIDPPDWVVCSVGDGCSIAGVHKGLAQMREIGLIDWRARMLGVQAASVAPIMKAIKMHHLDRSGTGHTYADSINVPVPRNWRKAVNTVKQSDGAMVAVSDEQIQEAVRQTGKWAGVFAEPAAAAAVAGVAEARTQGIIKPNASVVCMITGNGLKDIQGAQQAVGSPHEIPPDIGEVARIVDN